MENHLKVHLEDIEFRGTGYHDRLKFRFEVSNQNRQDLKIKDIVAYPLIGFGDRNPSELPRMYFRRVDELDRNQENNIVGEVDLYPGLMDKIEEKRSRAEKETLELQIRFEILGRWSNEDEDKRESFLLEFIRNEGVWEKVVERSGYYDERWVKMEFPNDGEGLQRVHSELEEAKSKHNKGLYDEALVRARKSLKMLNQIQKESDIRDRIDDEKIDRMDDFLDEFGSSLGNMESFTSLGAHSGEEIPDFDGIIEKKDSQLAISVTESFLEYFSRLNR